MVLPPAWMRLRSWLRRRLEDAQIASTELYRRLAPRCEPRQTSGEPRYPRHPFDLQHGVDTGGVLQGKQLHSGHPHDRHTAGYFGSQPSAFRAAIGVWRGMLLEDGYALEDFTFLDIGCGKGRVLMLASEFGFRRIVGIDLSPGLLVKARRNLRRWNRSPHPCPRLCQDISVQQADVLDFPLPDIPTLLYLYHPFEGELFATWARTLLAAARTRTAPLYVAYMNPVHEEHLLSAPETTRLWAGDLPFSFEDASAHVFGGTFERFALYRLTPPVRPAGV